MNARPIWMLGYLVGCDMENASPEVKSAGVLRLDIAPDVMKVCLFYIYTGALPLSSARVIHSRLAEMVRASEILSMPRFRGFIEKFIDELSKGAGAAASKSVTS